MHTWKINDDIVVFYYHFYGSRGLNYPTVSDISRRLGMSESSFNARIQNLIYVLTGGAHGLSNAATQTIEVAELFKYAQVNDPNFEDNLRALVNRILD